MTSHTYWASETDSETCVADVIKRIGAYRRALTYTGVAYRMIRSFNANQGYGPNGDRESSRTGFTGSNGQLLQLAVNEYGSMVNQTVVLVTSNKPTVKAVASNNDYASLAQTKFAEALNDYYDRELALSDSERDAARYMVLFGEAWCVLDWDNAKGEPWGVQEFVNEDGEERGAKLVRNGDVRSYTLTAFDVGRPASSQSVDDIEWFAWRRKCSKWEVAAQFPLKSDDVIACSPSEKMFSGVDDIDFNFIDRNLDKDADDYVYVWEFRHRPTAALPNGRLIKFIDAGVVLFDSVSTGVNEETGDVEVIDHGYPYGESLYAFSAASERVPGTSLGHTAFFDLLSLQEGFDRSASVAASAVNAGGLMNLYVPADADIEINKLSGVLNVIKYKGGKEPQAQANLDLPPAVLDFANRLKGWMQERVHLNEVVSGTPSAGMPAQGMALLRAQSVEFHSGLQEAYERLVQRHRTGVLQLLKNFASTERVALIAGKGNQWALREFKREDITNFHRFIVEPVNPAVKTLAGKVAFAQPLLQGGLITPQQYLQLFSTGRLEPISDFSAANQARIERNKELLMEGVGLPPFRMTEDGQIQQDPSGLPLFEDAPGLYVRPLITDTFWADIPEYLAILATPEVRERNGVTQKVLQLVQYCMKLWQAQPPAITAVLRGVAFPAPGQPPGGPGTVDNSGPKDPTTRMPDGSSPEGDDAADLPPGAQDENIKAPKGPKLRDADPSLNRAAQQDPVLANA